MKERNLFPDSINKKDTVLVCSMSEKYLDDSLRISSILRNNNISTDLYPDNPKLKKQLQYANNNDIPYVIIIGEDEVTSKLFTLKDMETGSQEKLGIDEIYCCSVNDSYVMNAWAKKMNISNVKVIPDGSGLFTKYMGMLISKDHDGFGQRSWRYMAIIKDGIVEKWWQEPGINNSGSDDDPYVETTPENSLKYLSASK